MIVDASPLLTDPKLNLTAPAQLLTVLRTLRRPLFILFIPSASDSSQPDPSCNWGGNWDGNYHDAYELVNKEFAKGRTPRYLAVLEVGTKEQWKSPDIIKKAWKIPHCPLLLRLQLHTTPTTNEVGIVHTYFTAFHPNNVPLRFFKKGNFSHLPSPFSIYKSKIYDITTTEGTVWDGWDYKFNYTSGMHNKLAKREMSKAVYLEKIRKMFEDMGMWKVDQKPRFVVPSRGIAPEILESEGGKHFVPRVETLPSDYEASEVVVGRVESMMGTEEAEEEDRVKREEEKNRWYGPQRRDSFVSGVESGVVVVNNDERFEELDGETECSDSKERRRIGWK